MPIKPLYKKEQYIQKFNTFCDLKSQCKELLYGKTHKINSSIIKSDWFKTSTLYNELIKSTSFLPTNCSINERLYCLFNNITNIKKCPICNTNKLPFSPSNNKGYHNTCSDRSCMAKKTYTNPNRKINNHSTIIKNRYKNFLKLLDKLNNNFTPTSKQNIIDFFEKTKLIHGGIFLINESHHDILCSLLYYTKNIIPVNYKTITHKLSLRLYCLTHNITTLPICSYCNVNQLSFISLKKGFRFSCNNTNCRKLVAASQRRLIHGEQVIPHITSVGYKVINYTGLNNTPVTLECEKGHIFEKDLSDGKWKNNIICRECYPLTSNEQKSLLDYIVSVYSGTVINNAKIAPHKEIDIYLPDLKLGFEYNGIFWHSINDINQLKDKKNHVNKTDFCENSGIRLIQILSTEWLYKSDIVKSRINSLLKLNSTIYARNTTVEPITTYDAINFLKYNHIQGYGCSSVNLGLFHKGELVACMTFSKSRFNKKYHWELVRYCSQTFTNVIGGANKLLKFFIKNYKPNSIISYADRRWSRGELYEKLGFEFLHNSKPNYFYYHPKQENKLFSRQMFQKHKLKNKLTTFDNNLTESQNMFNNGYRQIWDCGNKVYIKILE